MLAKILIFIVLTLSLHASINIKSHYYVDSNDINLSHVTPTKNDIKLFSFEQNRYTKRVKSKDFMKLLKSLGVNSAATKSRFIKFTKKSPIDVSKIETFLIELYKSKYSSIEIDRVSVVPRGYIDSLPKDYQIKIQSKSHLSNKGTLSIKTNKNRKIFFNYYIDAQVSVYMAKNNIKRYTELTLLNTIKKSIILEKFRALPIQEVGKGMLQSKQTIKHNSVITLRDVEQLSIVKRNAVVTISLNTSGMAISFSAVAQQDGKLNDIITVKKRDGKKLKVRVTGKNQAEIR